MRLLARCAALSIVALLIGCTGNPNAPAPAGASIVGTVRVRGSTSTPLVVLVSGTSLSTTVSPRGTFALSGVPAANIALLFEADTINARLPLGILRAGDRVSIVVSVNGSSATLQSREDESGAGGD